MPITSMNSSIKTDIKISGLNAESVWVEFLVGQTTEQLGICLRSSYYDFVSLEGHQKLILRVMHQYQNR